MQRILGQDHAIRILLDSWRSGRMHHAWIFSGPPGVGKFTTAVEFARLLLDPDLDPARPDADEPDPAGETSRRIDAGTHPDLHVIRKELALTSENALLRGRKLLNIPLDVLREFMMGGRAGDGKVYDGPAYRTASLGHGKIFIIDESELIDRTGQNALLKTLEEPPPQTYIILVTSRPERLLPTIRSRAQHVRFTALEQGAMEAWIQQSDLELDPVARRWIIDFAEGSPGLAMIAAKYNFHEWQQTLAPMLAQLEQGEFPITMGQTLADLIEAYAVAAVKSARNASKDAANKDGVRYLLALLSAHARRRLRETCDDEDSPWPAVIDLIRDVESQSASNVNLKQALENLVVQWTALRAPARA